MRWSCVSLLAVVFPLLSSCSSDTTGAPWVGTWRFSSQECAGVTMVSSGFARVTLVLSESKGTTIVEFTSGCVVRMEDYLITPIGGGRFVFPTTTSERVICDPNPCTGTLTSTIDGVTTTQQFTCPDDFPPAAAGATGRVESNFLIAEVDFGQGSICTVRYARDGS